MPVACCAPGGGICFPLPHQLVMPCLPVRNSISGTIHVYSSQNSCSFTAVARGPPLTELLYVMQNTFSFVDNVVICLYCI